jgi:tRNA(fMet)-specific endonuclease VapC
MAPKSAKPATNKARVETFLVGPFTILDFDADDAGVAGLLRAKLEKQGQPIGAYDLLIAAQGVRHGMTVVTNNLKEFKRVPGLSLEDWTL